MTLSASLVCFRMRLFNFSKIFVFLLPGFHVLNNAWSCGSAHDVCLWNTLKWSAFYPGHGDTGSLEAAERCLSSTWVARKLNVRNDVLKTLPRKYLGFYCVYLVLPRSHRLPRWDKHYIALKRSPLSTLIITLTTTTKRQKKKWKHVSLYTLPHEGSAVLCSVCHSFQPSYGSPPRSQWDKV